MNHPTNVNELKVYVSDSSHNTVFILSYKDHHVQQSKSFGASCTVDFSKLKNDEKCVWVDSEKRDFEASLKLLLPCYEKARIEVIYC